MGRGGDRGQAGRRSRSGNVRWCGRKDTREVPGRRPSDSQGEKLSAKKFGFGIRCPWRQSSRDASRRRYFPRTARARDGGPHLQLLDDVLFDRLVPRFRFE